MSFFKLPPVELTSRVADAQPQWSRPELIVLAAIMGVGAILRVACVIEIPSPLESDYLGYWTIAKNLHAGLGLVGEDGRPTAFLSLGYPLFLAGVFSIFGTSIAVVKAANVCLGIASIFLVYFVSRRLFGSRLAAASGASLLAIYLEAVSYTSYVAKENLMIFLIMTQFALAINPQSYKGWRLYNPILFGVATGCLAIVGNAGLALLPALMVQITLARGSAVRATFYLLIAALATIVVITPIIFRNHAVFGGYVINNNGGFNLYIGNNPNATPYFESIAETPLADRWDVIHAELGERGADLMLHELAVQHILQNPGTTLQLALRKAVAFWWPPLHSGKYQEGLIVEALRIGWFVEFLMICGLFLGGLIYARRNAPSISVLWLMVTGYTAVHMIFYVIYRYRLPIMPIICIGAGQSVQMVISRALGSSNPELGNDMLRGAHEALDDAPTRCFDCSDQPRKRYEGVGTV